MAKLSFDDGDGIWRTVGGKHIFIKNGENLSSAMKKSGKFKIQRKKESNNSDIDKKRKLEELEKKKEETIGFLQKGAIQEEIDMLKDDFKGTKEEYREYLSKEREKRLEDYKKEKEKRLKIKEQQEKESGQRDYRMAHRPSKGATLDDITTYKGDDDDEYSPTLPKDFYQHPEYYGNMKEKTYQESFNAIKQARNNPNGKVIIYRATTGNKINEGDWITLSKSYAEQHNESSLEGKGKVIKMEVPIKDVRFAGDDFNEFGYFPQKDNSNKIYLKAYNEYKKEHPNSKITFQKFKNNILEK